MDEAIASLERARNLHAKAWERKSMIPEFLWATEEFMKKTLDQVFNFLCVLQKDEKLKKELEAANLIMKEEILKEMDSFVDDLSVMNNEARFIISRNSTNDASMDKMSAEVVQHYAKQLGEKIKSLKEEVKSL